MADLTELEIMQLQRELGKVAGRAEDARVAAEEALRAEQFRTTVMEGERDALTARLITLEATLAVERRLAAEASEAFTRREISLRVELETGNAAHESELAGLRGEVEVLHGQLAEARSHLAAVTSAASDAAEASTRREVALRVEVEAKSSAYEHELSMLRGKIEALTQQLAAAVPGDSTAVEDTASASAAEAGSLRREVSGLITLVATLRRKVKIYEDRLLLQARTCADELNDLTCQVVTSASPGSSTVPSPEGREAMGESEEHCEEQRSLPHASSLGLEPDSPTSSSLVQQQRQAEQRRLPPTALDFAASKGIDAHSHPPLGNVIGSKERSAAAGTACTDAHSPHPGGDVQGGAEEQSAAAAVSANGNVRVKLWRRVPELPIDEARSGDVPCAQSPPPSPDAI